MSTHNRAVFLSYASQDAETARRICEALRVAGVEVWFDQSELRGGDAWDAKIRKQIKECALFVPIISANTQARLEGYFRLEWKLAAQRTHTMADAKPFLVPVCIDDTRDADAHVPEEFRAVQWTRLPRAAATDTFVKRVEALIVGESATQPSSARASERFSIETGPARSAKRRWLARCLAGLAAVGVMAVWQPWRRHAEAVTSAPKPTEVRRTDSEVAGTGVGGIARLGMKSIAVLPFQNLSEDPNANAFFAEGVHEDLLTNLLLIRELRVVPRATIITYYDPKKSPRQIAEDLGVAYVLTGSVRRVGQKVRITGTLINGRTEEGIWTKPYDKDLGDAGAMFAVQSELAQSIAAELKATLSPQERRLVERRPTENAAAYDLFLQARALRNANLREPKKAEALLFAAVALDPKFAVAWSELQFVHGHLYAQNNDHSAERLKQATVAFETATHLAPDDPDVMRNSAYYFLQCQSNYARALELCDRALHLQPNAAEWHHARGGTLRWMGRMAAALDAFRRAAELDPGNLDTAAQVYLTECTGNRWEAARAASRRVNALRAADDGRQVNDALLAFFGDGSIRAMAETASQGDETAQRQLAVMRGDFPEIIRSHLPLPALEESWSWFDVERPLIVARAFAAQGKTDEGRTHLAGLPAIIRRRLARDDSNASIWADLGLVEAALGNFDEAVRCLQRATELVPESSRPYSGPIYRVDTALVDAWRGEKGAAVAELARLLRTPKSMMSTTSRNASTLNVHMMRTHPFYFPLRDDPRFEAVLNDPKNNAPLF